MTQRLVSLQLRSRDGSEYLIQHDSEAIISTWHKAIAQAIQELVGRAWSLQGWEGGDGKPLCKAAVPTVVGGTLHSGPRSSMAPVGEYHSRQMQSPPYGRMADGLLKKQPFFSM